MKTHVVVTSERPDRYGRVEPDSVLQVFDLDANPEHLLAAVNQYLGPRDQAQWNVVRYIGITVL